ncbi:hypothetical protein [Flaviflexus huanghaiensis]|uniref:hypothetical protein n=1 Tax=Flaviflexus huanghaiensis TaxID=1111473 RepID=UPI0019D635C6|nr:hypothetical protein [Flaviflexus huanghaiensis]
MAVIIACEIAFWVFVILGLLARYVLRLRRTGTVLLAMTPVVDVVLLIAVIINVQGGGTATFFHGLAALYLGLSIAYGLKIIRWADTRFAHRFAQGPAPVKLYAAGYAKECWKDVVRTAVAVAIAASILGLLIAITDDTNRTEALIGMYPVLGIWFVIDLLWAISYTFWPKKHPKTTM